MKIVASFTDVVQCGPSDFFRVNYAKQFCETDTLESVIDWYMSKFPRADRKKVLSGINFSYLETD